MRKNEMKLVDFSKLANGTERLQVQILRVLAGIGRPRTEPLSRQDIRKVFAGTPAIFVSDALWKLVNAEMVRPCQNGLDRNRAGTVYELTLKPELDHVANCHSTNGTHPDPVA